MKIDQFEKVVALEADKSIFGQWISIVSVTDTDKNLKPEFRKKGILKVSQFSAHVRKQSYIDLLNTSTGAVEVGVEFKSKRPSHYNSVAHEGFCSELKSDPTQKYFIVKFNENDTKTPKTIYLDAEMNVLDEDTILAERSGGNIRSQLVNEVAKVQIRNFKLTSIAKMSVGGLQLVDEDLQKYIDKLNEE